MEPDDEGTKAGGEQTRSGQEGAARGRTATRLTDPRALRAYAHPVRMALVGLLRTEGPLTATRAAELLGESSGTCSFRTRAQGARAGRYLLRAPAQAGTAAAGRAADRSAER